MVSATLFTILLPVAQQVVYADGTLDRTFGQGGTVTTTFGDGTQVAARDVAIQPDGKIVVVGQINNSNGSHIALARYNTNGSLDPTFGVKGRVVTEVGLFEVTTSVALQLDGKIVVAGATATPEMMAVRYNPNGSLDTGFGTQGVATVSFGSPFDRVNSVAIQRDGKIVLVGTTGFTHGFNFDIAVARLNADGSLDTSFADNGKSVVDLGGFEEGTAVAIQNDGKIVVGSHTAQPSGVVDFLIVRYNTDGQLDPTFGNGGLVTTDFGHQDFVTDIAIQRDGKIVAVGNLSDVVNGKHTEDFGAARYNADGSLDAGFGNGGLVITDLGFTIEQPNAVALQADGKIVVAGVSNNLKTAVLLRYDSDGSLDNTFGSGGVVRSDAAVTFAAVAIQSDTNIVAVGSIDVTSFVLSRFLGSTSPAPQP
jgi:uncharacterized delta-60 repeat protein